MTEKKRAQITITETDDGYTVEVKGKELKDSLGCCCVPVNAVAIKGGVCCAPEEPEKK